MLPPTKKLMIRYHLKPFNLVFETFSISLKIKEIFGIIELKGKYVKDNYL